MQNYDFGFLIKLNTLCRKINKEVSDLPKHTNAVLMQH